MSNTGNGSRRRDDVIQYDISGAGAIAADLGTGYDLVEISGGSATRPQVRVTFTSAEVGNGRATDGGALANQDGGLAVRVQAENASDTPTGRIDRFDDEGISFVSDGSFTFDVRDLVSGVARGDQFQVVRLGTVGADFYDEVDAEGTRSLLRTYINAGQGADFVRTGSRADFLVGGGGDDELLGGAGNDSYIGGTGNDIITDRGDNGDDTVIFNVSTDGSDRVSLGSGADTVRVSAAAGTTQVRLTFTSAEVGNNRVIDGTSTGNQDGGLAVRLQAEDGSDMLTGGISRFDDEGITFVSTTPGLTFDVRDLVSGVARGDQFQVVRLGTHLADVIDFTGQTATYYVNAGQGNDRIIGGGSADFLVGGVGNDVIDGAAGNDAFIGGAGADRFVFSDTPGNDRILDFSTAQGDKIDLRAFDVDFADVTQSSNGSQNVLSIDTTGDGAADFTITLANNATVAAGDFLF